MSKTLQQEIANGITQKFKDAVVKKIDKDNYLDIHLPSVHPKKGTHLGINTAKGEIKIVFYCREDDFNTLALNKSKKIEEYAQGLRIIGNPAFNIASKAIEASIDFVLELMRVNVNSTKTETTESKTKKASPQNEAPKKAEKKKEEKPDESEDASENSQDEEEIVEDEVEQNADDVISLEDFDVNEDSVINFISDKIKRGKYLTNLLYVNQALDSKGYVIDKHQAYFFDSSVLISDNEMEGFLVVNMDGFYSNCVNEDEMQMIFSWSGANDLEYQEDGDDCSIDIIADRGRLTIKKEGSHSLKILYTFYKHVWKAINDKFKDEPFIAWNDVWDMGIKEVGFAEFLDYFTFDLTPSEDDAQEAEFEEDEEVDEEDKKLKNLLVNYGVDSESELTSITLEQANELADCKVCLDLSGLTSFSEKLAEVLSKHEGDLLLDGLTSLSDKATNLIATHKGGYLSLEGLTTLTDTNAQALSQHKKLLFLKGLTTLSENVAKLLARHKGSLVLDGLTNLSEPAIEMLASHKDGFLSLDGLTSLSDKALEALAKHQGSLYLNGLTNLSDKAALALSKHEEELCLNGLTNLSDKAAIALSKHEGELSLDGLTSLSDKAAEALAEKGISIS